ncbi:hypothetical protein J3D43_002485 [Paenibacillus xylanexedens]|nr:hypothetical protein [Paenibacillus xylanexedens]
MSISQLGNGSFRKEVDYKEKILDGDVYLPLYIECDQHIKASFSRTGAMRTVLMGDWLTMIESGRIHENQSWIQTDSERDQFY